MKEDIVELINRFDNYLDNMFDRGEFDPTDEYDAELDNFIKEMKDKYLK